MVAAIVGVAAAGASLIGSSMQASAAGKAADQQTQAQLAAIQEQQRQYDLTRGDLGPYREYGTQSLAALNKLMNGDYSGFDKSPDYLYAKQQAIGASDASAAARGGLYGGGHSADLASLASGLASQNLGNYRNFLEWGGNLGENASAQTGQIGQNAANAISDAYGNIGNAQAQGTIGSANAWANGANQIGSIFGNLSQSSFGGGGNPFGNMVGSVWGDASASGSAWGP